jgi:hypothetical protein
MRHSYIAINAVRTRNDISMSRMFVAHPTVGALEPKAVTRTLDRPMMIESTITGKISVSDRWYSSDGRNSRLRLNHALPALRKRCPPPRSTNTTLALHLKMKPITELAHEWNRCTIVPREKRHGYGKSARGLQLAQKRTYTV